MANFPIPADRVPVQPTQSIVLKGIGPAMHITSKQPSKIMLVGKTRTQSIKTKGITNIQFAA